MTYQAEKQIQELGDKVPAADKDKIDGLIKDLREAISQEDFDRIKTLHADLQQALYSVSANLYQQAGGTTGAPDGDGSGPSASGGSGSAGDDVIDAEFSESETK